MPFRVNAFFWGHAWIKEIPPQERGMGALSHSIVIDAADQPHIVYDEVVAFGTPANIVRDKPLENFNGISF